MVTNSLNISMDVETGDYLIHTEDGYNKVCEIIDQKEAERAAIKDDEPRRFTISTEIGRLKRAAKKWREDNPVPVIDYEQMTDVVDFFRMVWGREGEIAAKLKHPNIGKQYEVVHNIYLNKVAAYDSKTRETTTYPGNWSHYVITHFLLPMFEEVLDIHPNKRTLIKDPSP